MNFVSKVFLPFFLLASNFFLAQTTHDVAIVGNSFSPQEVTINVNDAVRWTNNGGIHNVVADDNSFTSGSPSTAIWVYTHTFDTEGDFGYYCEVHGSTGFGMYGIVHVMGATGVNDDVSDSDYRLRQNYPNPFNPTTVIEYSIPNGSFVTLKIFNVTGSLEKTLISEYQPSGNYLVEFNADGLTTGIYFYQLSTGDFISTRRMVLLK